MGARCLPRIHCQPRGRQLAHPETHLSSFGRLDRASVGICGPKLHTKRDRAFENTLVGSTPAGSAIYGHCEFEAAVVYYFFLSS